MNAKTDMARPAHQGSARETLTMWDILDLAQFRVYVVDVLSHEIVYVNNNRQPREGNGDAKCYRMIYQEDRPCLSCKIPELVDAGGRPDGRILTSERFDEAA